MQQDHRADLVKVPLVLHESNVINCLLSLLVLCSMITALMGFIDCEDASKYYAHSSHISQLHVLDQCNV